MIYEILSRIFLYTFLIIGIFYSTKIDTPIKVTMLHFPRLIFLFRKLGFLSNWAIFTSIDNTSYDIEVVARLKSGKVLRWFLSDNKSIGNIKIYNPTVKKNTLSFFMSYQYFHQVIENYLLNYAYDTLKDPMLELKIYLIHFDIEKNKKYILREQKRPIPKQPPKIIYEAKWEY